MVDNQITVKLSELKPNNAIIIQTTEYLPLKIRVELCDTTYTLLTISEKPLYKCITTHEIIAWLSGYTFCNRHIGWEIVE